MKASPTQLHEALAGDREPADFVDDPTLDDWMEADKESWANALENALVEVIDHHPTGEVEQAIFDGSDSYRAEMVAEMNRRLAKHIEQGRAWVSEWYEKRLRNRIEQMEGEA